MAFKLEDLINKKKEPTQILDLAKVKIKSKEEFEKYFDKIPEFKIRPEKVRTEDTKLRDHDFSFAPPKKGSKSKKHEYVYGDPIPASMRSVRLEDLVAVDISWRMLTMARPQNKLEEDIFSRLVELGKLRLSTRRQEQEQQQGFGGGPSSSSNPNSKGGAGSSGNFVASNNSPQALAQLGITVSKNKRGVTETRIRTCKECGEELCTGQWCKEFPYDSYTRMILDKDELAKQEAEERGERVRRTSKMKEMGPGGKPGKAKLSKKKAAKRSGSPRKKKQQGCKTNISKAVLSVKGKEDDTPKQEVPTATAALKGNKVKKKRKKKPKSNQQRAKTTDESDN